MSRQSPSAPVAGAPGLDLGVPPFDLLDRRQAERVRAATDVVLFRAHQRAIEAGAASAAVYVILKGRVVSIDTRGGQSQHFAEYEAGELFGAFAAIAGRARHGYEALEDTLCYAIPAELFVALTRENERFGAYFHESLEVKSRLLAERDQPSDLAELMLTRIRDALVVEPALVEPTASIADAVAAMRVHHTDCVLIERSGERGIATRTDLLDALAFKRASPGAQVVHCATFPVLALDENEFMFQALVLMTERHIHRVAVTRDGALRGTLGLMELLSHFSSKSHVVSLRIARAADPAQLAHAAAELGDLVRTLYSQGAKVTFLMELMSALNGRLMGRLFELLVPEPMRLQSCLLVLGSEGRREQILKTDQDNALILADGLSWPELDETAAAFSRNLEAMGYPVCPGGVMVSNPAWRRSQSDWLAQIDAWSARPDPAAVLELAILFDAHAIAGAAALLAPLRARLFALGQDNVAMRAFIQPAVDFSTPLTLFGEFKGGDAGTDIKRGGIFPIVHGLRALALMHGVEPNNSFERAERLIALGVLHERTGRDLMQALAAMIRLRLGAQLAALKRGESAGNRIDARALRRLDRDLLRDALRVTNDFKTWLSTRFRLE